MKLEPSAEVTFGPFQFDPVRRRLARQGELVSVGQRALDVLWALVQANGAVVTKAQLMAQVWPGVTVEENNLQVQVSALRRALGDSADSGDYVKTVSGRGYLFVGNLSSTGTGRQDFAQDGLPPFPAQEVKYCRTKDGVHLAVATLGEGPPLVRAPVWMSHVEYDWRTSIWAYFLEALSQHHRLIRYDARGTGLSDRQVDEISFEASVADLETVVDTLGLERFSLLGISLGVPVSIAYAERHPDRVHRLVLSSGYARGTKTLSAAHAEATTALVTLVRDKWGNDNPAFRQLITSLAFPTATSRQMGELNELQRWSASSENAARILDMVTNVDVSQALGRVRTPTLVLHNRGDAWVTADRSREIARGLPGARFVELPGPNHIVLPQDDDFQRYISEILNFVEGV